MSLLNRRSFLTTTAAGLSALPTARGMTLPSEPAKEDPLGVRAEFPITRNYTFLNTAWIGPIPQVARDAAVDYADENLVWADIRSRLMQRDMARTAFAELFGAKPDEVALLFTTADGEAVVTHGLDLKPGDNIVVDALHYSGTFLLYKQLQEQKGIELRVVPETEGRVRVEDFEPRIDERTRLVSVAWVSNRNGYRHDLGAIVELAHAKGTLVYADSVQALGTFDTNLTELGVDFACAAAHKWLFAGFGAAPFFIREEHLDRIRPDRYGHGQIAETLTSEGSTRTSSVTGQVGGQGRFPERDFRLRTTAEKYEYSCVSYSTVAQLAATLGLFKKIGLSRIEAHTMPLAQELRDGIAELGFETWTPKDNGSPIVTFVHGQDIEHLKRLLEEEAISVSFREKNDTLMRVSVSMFNNRADVQRLLKLLEKIA